MKVTRKEQKCFLLLLGCAGLICIVLIMAQWKYPFSCETKQTTSTQTYKDYLQNHVEFYINPKRLCGSQNETLQLLILVPSHPKYFERRQTIRATWGNTTTSSVRVAFLFGMVADDTVSESIEQESCKYRDIIQGNFIDSYHNLTLKSMVLLKWTLDHCFNAHFVLKCDDDVFVHVEKLLDRMDYLNRPDLIMGRHIHRHRVVRDPNSKWYVSPDQYSEPDWPAYFLGPFYLIRTSILTQLFKSCLDYVHIPMEDVVVTGLCPRSIGVQQTELEQSIVYPFENKSICNEVVLARLDIDVKSMVSIYETSKSCSTVTKETNSITKVELSTQTHIAKTYTAV